jgi:hypothetical protein
MKQQKTQSKAVEVTVSSKEEKAQDFDNEYGLENK